jgi:PAS domain S-box-containing protein
MKTDDPLETLRAQAEAQTSTDNFSRTDISPEEAARIIHELKVHQIELQIQNEELRRSQEELIHSRDRFGKLFNHAPVGYLMLDANGTIAETNEMFCSMVGLDIKQVKGRGLNEFVIPTDQSMFLSRFRPFFKHPEGKYLELGLVSQAEIPVFVQISATIFSESNSMRSMSAAPHLLVAISNITERKEAENTLRESEEKYRVVFNNEIYAICIFDLESLRFLDANDAYIKLYGYSKAELLENLTIHDITVQHQESNQATHQAVSSGTIYIPLRYHKKKDGTVFPVEIVGGPYTWKGKKVMFAVFRDISERFQAEVALKESKEAYDKLVAQVPVGLYKLRMKEDGDMIFDYVSPRFCEMMQLDSHDILKNHQMAFDCIHPEDRNHFLETNETARRSEKPFQWEGRFVIGNDIRFFHMESLPERMENGDIVWTGTQRDITDEKRLEDEKKELEYRLQQARKTESLGRMAGAIAHNFNNQLYAVLGNIELALMDLPHGSEAAASISQAQKAADKAARISRLMLTYLGQGLGKREPLDISSICRTALSQMMESIPTGITLTTNLLSHGPVIKADNQQIQLILINLITNAWEAIGEKQGNIRLSVRTVSGGNIPLSHRLPVNWQPKESLYACLEVVDTGCGIRREDIEKICDPFYSTKFTGRGLGLSVVIGIVCAYDGGITVESQPDRGSTFLIYLPISSEEPFRKSLA